MISTVEFWIFCLLSKTLFIKSPCTHGPHNCCTSVWSQTPTNIHTHMYISKVWLHQFQFIQVSAQLNLFMGRNPEDSNLSQRAIFSHLDNEFTHELHIKNSHTLTMLIQHCPADILCLCKFNHLLIGISSLEKTCTTHRFIHGAMRIMCVYTG